METAEEKEEETLLYLDFTGVIDPDMYSEPNLTFKIEGLDTEKPQVQVGNRLYEGSYEDTMGTHVFFEKDKKPASKDPFSKDVPCKVKYYGKTNKMLRMSYKGAVLDSDQSQDAAGSSQSSGTVEPELYKNVEEYSVDEAMSLLEKTKLTKPAVRNVEVSDENDSDSST